VSDFTRGMVIQMKKKNFEPNVGDLVHLYEKRLDNPRIRLNTTKFYVGNLDANGSGFPVPSGSIALIMKVDQLTGVAQVIIGNRPGWVYFEDCEPFNESR